MTKNNIQNKKIKTHIFASFIHDYFCLISPFVNQIRINGESYKINIHVILCVGSSCPIIPQFG